MITSYVTHQCIHDTDTVRSQVEKQLRNLEAELEDELETCDNAKASLAQVLEEKARLEQDLKAPHASRPSCRVAAPAVLLAKGGPPGVEQTDNV